MGFLPESTYNGIECHVDLTCTPTYMDERNDVPTE